EIARLLALGADSQPEAGSYFPELEDYNTGPSGYLRHLEAAKAALSIPVIASLNGATEGGWTHHARLLEEAGADALELNVYVVAADPDLTSADIEPRFAGSRSCETTSTSPWPPAAGSTGPPRC